MAAGRWRHLDDRGAPVTALVFPQEAECTPRAASLNYRSEMKSGRLSMRQIQVSVSCSADAVVEASASGHGLQEDRL